MPQSESAQSKLSAAPGFAPHAIVIGAGLAGLVAACELLDRGRKVLIIDQENEHNLGGQAWWSFGGLFLVDSPEQRRLGVKDSLDLALQDWFATAGFDRPEDEWPRKWARAYVEWAADGKREWLADKGIRFFPIVGWAERGAGTAIGHGNSVPRFHITWGTGPGLVEPFAAQVLEAVATGHARILQRHRVDDLLVENDVVVGAKGAILIPDDAPRGQASSREVAGRFEHRAQAVIVASGGIGGNHELVRKFWPRRLGEAPRRMLSGVPAHVDGRMLEITERAGGTLINQDRMWHYTEGIENFAPVWDRHGIRILPGPSSLWFDATGKRLPTPLWPGFDTLGTLEHIVSTGHDHSWFVLTQKIIEKEFALSGSEQNPDLTGKDLRLLAQRLGKGAPAPVEAFKREGVDFIVRDTLDELLAEMTARSGDVPFDAGSVRAEVRAHDRLIANEFGKDAQLNAVRQARTYRGDKLIRVASPHQVQDPAAGPFIAVKLNILTRKSLGGIHTDLDGRVLDESGTPVPGLFAAGEAAGFGGGGVHGYRSLEGTFLGGCLFSGRIAGSSAAER
jgi:predicted oxidoreductase